MYNKKTSTLVALAGAFCASLIISNILASKTWVLLGLTLPAAVVMFPLVYIVNDVLAELYDYSIVSKVILTGFIMNLVAVVAYSIALALPPSPFFTGQEAFNIVLSTSFRVLVASLSAYLVGSFANLRVMNKLKYKHGRRKLAFRCILSTVVGESLDALVFITIAFVGTVPAIALVSMILGQAAFKVAYEILAFPITRAVINKLK